MNVLACSYHCWFPGRLNGQCSGVVRMNDWPLSSHDNFLPTHCSNPPLGPLIWLVLILSFLPSFSFSSSLYLSLSLSLSDLSTLAKKIKLEAMAGYHSNQQHGRPNGENGDHNPGLGESHPFVHPHTGVCAHEMCNHGRVTRCAAAVCDAKSIRLEQLCLCAAAESSWLNQDVTSPLLPAHFLWEMTNKKQNRTIRNR